MKSRRFQLYTVAMEHLVFVLVTLSSLRASSAFTPQLMQPPQAYPPLRSRRALSSSAASPRHNSWSARCATLNTGNLDQRLTDLISQGLDATAEAQEADAALPIFQIIPQLQQEVLSDAHHNIVLEAPPGAGKTTMIPLAVLHSWIHESSPRRIWMIEPRRVAARSAAYRMSALLGESVGTTVGYAIRGEARTSAATRITVVTDGVLLNRLRTDPELKGIDMIVLDEFHERGVGSDTILALSRECQNLLRPDLKMIVMSATLLGNADGSDDEDDDATQSSEASAPVPALNSFGDKLVNTLGGHERCNILKSAGRQYPITVRWGNEVRSLQSSGHMLPFSVVMKDRKQLVSLMCKAIEEATTVAPNQGSILVFLPGVAEIRRVIQQLEQSSNGALEDMEILPLYGALPKDQQDYAIFPNLNKSSSTSSKQQQQQQQQPQRRRRIVVATPIAEASLTIEGITCVVDSGLRREARCDADTGMPRLVTTRCSQASAIQRAGRAGRTQAGLCLRLYNEVEFEQNFVDQTPAEILNTDLSDTVLTLAEWGCSNVDEILNDMAFVDPPDEALLMKSVHILKDLECLESDDSDDHSRKLALTQQGRAVTKIPAHPRIATTIVKASTDQTLLAAAVISAFMLDDEVGAHRALKAIPDLTQRALEMLKKNGPRSGNSNASKNARRAMMQFAARISKEAADAMQMLQTSQIATNDVVSCIGRSLLPGYVDLIGERKKDASYGGSIYMLSLGRSVRLDDTQDGPEFAVILETSTGDDGIARIRSFAPIDKELLQSVAKERTVTFTVPSRGHEVRARSSMMVGSLELSSTPLPSPPADTVAKVLLDVIRQQGGVHASLVRNLSGDRRKSIDDLCARVGWAQTLGDDNGDITWPRCFDALKSDRLGSATVDEQHLLEQLIEPWLPAAGSLKHVNLLDILQAELSPQQRQELDNHFPQRIAAPDGTAISIAYTTDVPTASGKLQQFFGTVQSPCIGPPHNTRPVTLSLLSPAGKPLAQTQDLEFFWKEAYPSVRSEMRGKYVKHPWPENPMAAVATRQTNKQQRRQKETDASGSNAGSDDGSQNKRKKKKRGKKR